MSAATAVPLSEYLNTSYRPDCDYLEGELLERNVGEWDHARMQMLLSHYLCSREKQLGIMVVPEQRVQVKTRRFRVPDITVLNGPRPAGGIITAPPFLCVEILSPSDRVTEMQVRVDDYLAFGVRYVWVIDPVTGLTFVHTPAGVQEVRNGILATENPDIVVDLNTLE
ncbi:MAG TPA: Uma2 family endonuclease [Bryobacteraceae bacterium]